jgi:hypothetical protein
MLLLCKCTADGPLSCACCRHWFKVVLFIISLNITDGALCSAPRVTRFGGGEGTAAHPCAALFLPGMIEGQTIIHLQQTSGHELGQLRSVTVFWQRAAAAGRT